MRTEKCDRPQMIAIGRICGGHGLDGELRIQPLTDFPERFVGMERLRLFHPDGREWRDLHPTRFRLLEGKGLLLAMTEEITDRTAADLLKGALVKVSPEERVALPEGQYWIDDLLGLVVRDEETGEKLGVVEEILQTGSNDCYMVRTSEGKLRPLPAIRDVVRKVDLEARTMSVSLLEGLWD
ncbi:MAG: ribosome maturation factor RimM [Synergistales bacterium]